MLCNCHIKRASNNNKVTTRSSGFNHLTELGVRFPFLFHGVEQSSQFRPKELCEIYEKHLHHHPLILNDRGQFFTKNEVYETAIKEMYIIIIRHEAITIFII